MATPLDTCEMPNPSTSVFYSIYSCVYWVLAILTIRIPAYLLQLVSYTITIELNFRLAVLLASVLLSTISHRCKVSLPHCLLSAPRTRCPSQ
ncbi:hypothetical protein DSO57_1030677 [Entomophthora muscae]|uniref:Uncharacterized protein n=1 Tax=Entomophthora muscae TaxID=34485 RepID=A0ACC2RFN6_9FUNG|nr:hypothetical protein DSO57_1030677 [Entomophthora muscae]